MELDKRVSEIETELKIMKGEIKGLLVDIRDLVSKKENPFCSIQRLEASKLKIPETEECEGKQPDVTCNGENEMKPVAGISELGNQNVKNSENSLKLAGSLQGNSVQDVHKQEIHRLEIGRKIDTCTLVELMRWVDYAVRTIGHRNLEELLNLYTFTGHLPGETKEVIKNIAELSIEEPAGEDGVNMKDNIMVLSQLSAILNPEDFKKNIQPYYESSSGWKGKEEKKEGLVFN
ncbi:hypothetical protein [Methanosarcina siciliae]|uniref:hypothetical protein n=1 Tax=Methanosarcina siciliae TaxID=38027 RepID=UPI00064FFE3F|nr:hypothetical protein [Methanosarcina siciliae]